MLAMELLFGVSLVSFKELSSIFTDLPLFSPRSIICFEYALLFSTLLRTTFILYHAYRLLRMN